MPEPDLPAITAVVEGALDDLAELCTPLETWCRPDHRGPVRA
jgi:hypothetical protein